MLGLRVGERRGVGDLPGPGEARRQRLAQQGAALEVLEDRYHTRSTLVTSQLPVEKWHACIADPTFADAILDRLVHNAYKFKLKGESMRKTQAKSTQADHQQA